MPPRDKSKAAGVSASSFFDLKAELAKKEEEFTKAKAAGKATALVGGVKRPDKKPTVWARQNSGVKSRAARDIELEAVDRPTLEAAQAKLQRKAEIYEKLMRGKSGGLSEKQLDTLLVDFDQKAADHYESDSDDVDESLTVPGPPGGAGDDPVIEYEDEFGRVRTARRSEVPRHLLPASERDEQDDEDDFDPYVIHNPVDHFPVYEPSAERVEAIQKEFSEENNPLNIHYDAAREVRAKGAGFYQFSGDEETRQRQMEELRRAREETERTRQDTGALDVRPGELEGMRAPEADAVGIKRSRAMEKRKRELEERRRLLDAKRRKTGKGSAPPDEPEPGPPPPPLVAEQNAVAPRTDPFAMLEAAAPTGSIGKGKGKETVTVDPADAFLAQLERDVLKRVR
ncbi:hypothetical protein CERSUDRAFT_98059 [Gelatoporia subvermispora B]|uniref:Coiled-coil domain-containing protein 174 n=1 Tax=Ceriporiopsis subvermispora (strain B) TaxID=914234 RepID=M2PE47_CERS8|nr:hypothetical protein CERSUDRAFT_98059 [Gelatoporia subvermispora B]